MPNKDVSILLKRIDDLHERLEGHLEEASGVKTNIDWLIRWTWVSIGTSLTTLGTLIVYLLVKK